MIALHLTMRTRPAGEHDDDMASGILEALQCRSEHGFRNADRNRGGHLHGHAVGGRGLDDAGNAREAKQVGRAWLRTRKKVEIRRTHVRCGHEWWKRIGRAVGRKNLKKKSG